MVKKRVISAVFAVAVGVCAGYGGYRLLNAPDTVLSEANFKSFVERCQGENRMNFHGCVLGQVAQALPFELAHGGVFVGAAVGLGLNRRRILRIG